MRKEKFCVMFQPWANGTVYASVFCLCLTIRFQDFNISGFLTAFINVLSFSWADIASEI